MTIRMIRYGSKILMSAQSRKIQIEYDAPNARNYLYDALNNAFYEKYEPTSVKRTSAQVYSRPKYFMFAIKRAADILGSAAALILFAPLMATVSVLIVALDPGPVFYRQERIGLNGRRFRIFKFRSMCTNADQVLAEVLARDAAARSEWATRQKLANDPRITWFGRFLRRSSIDELPQFINVLLGHMSLVGPRPIVEGEAARYGRYLGDYCGCRPGITGLWQVSGRSNTTYQRRIALDVAYSRSLCFLLDLRILAKTIPVVIGSEGCS